MTKFNQSNGTVRRTTAYNRATVEPELVWMLRKTFVAMLGTGEPERRSLRRKSFLVGGIARQLATIGMAPRGIRTPHIQYGFLPDAHPTNISDSYAANPLSEQPYRTSAEVGEDVTVGDLAVARRQVRSVARQDEFEISSIPEQLVIQVIHYGPFGTEAATMALLGAAAESFGVKRTGPHQEIYVTPRYNHTTDRGLRTVLRDPVA